MGPFGIELGDEVVEAGLLLEAVHAWRTGCFFLESEVHALVASVLLRVAWLDALDGDAEAEPPDREPGEVEEGIGAGEGDAVVGADGLWQSALTKEAVEGGECEVLPGGLEGFAEQQEAGGLVGDGEGIAVAAVAEAELALEVYAPQVVGGSCRGEGGAGGVVALAALALDETVAIEDGVDGALGRQTHMAVEAADEELPDLAGAPVRLVAFEGDDQAFDLGRELIGIAHRPPGSVGEGLKAVLLVAIEDIVSGLARDAELAAQVGHCLALQQAGDEAQALFHGRTLLPGHPYLPPAAASEKCYPCVRYEVSPMSRVAHAW